MGPPGAATTRSSKRQLDHDLAEGPVLRTELVWSWFVLRNLRACDKQHSHICSFTKHAIPVACSDGPCPLCDGIADGWGDHARACPCGGDRVKRHNRLRTYLAGRLAAAGLSPELEKPGLLPVRPEEAGLSKSGAVGVDASGRRPADIYLPAWGLHGPAALDLAVSSGLRSAVLAASAQDGGHAASAYESRKRSFQNTDQQCRGQGLQFLPVVAEACGGGLAPQALVVLRTLGSLLAAKTGQATSTEVEHLYQGLSVALQRESARAVLRRLPALPAGAHAYLPEP
eukprot:Skav208438  [mRNA]  locus=scaffold1952:148218:149072:+ [translate_table: standard]